MEISYLQGRHTAYLARADQTEIAEDKFAHRVMAQFYADWIGRLEDAQPEQGR